MKTLQVVSALILFAILFVSHADAQMAKATLVVVSEKGDPIEGVDTGVGFEVNTISGIESNSSRGLTGSDGRFSARGDCDGIMFFNARKAGYYYSSSRYDFKTKNLFGWQPWNPELKVVLRKIENPIPMYARKTDNLMIPVVGEPIGFDMVAFDWVSPYGKGHKSDFIFTVEKEVKSKREFTSKLIIEFDNEYDGIQVFKEKWFYGSEMKLPRFAPETGYAKSMELKFDNSPVCGISKTSEKDDNYIFRIRSKEENGKIIAMYGKIIGPIKFEPRNETANFIFKYYLNPDYTRNLEFDPKRNLFGKLPPLERVGIK